MRIAVHAFDGITMFHLAAPLLVFGEVGRQGLAAGWETSIWTDDGCGVRTAEGLTIENVHGPDVVDTADFLVFPSWPSDLRPVSPCLAGLIRTAHAKGTRVVGLCLGAFPLAASGLLDGRSIVTHWAAAPVLARLHPTVTVIDSALYLDHGDVLTSAGTASAIDACLHMVRTHLGSAAASTVARHLVIAPHRDGDQAQYIDRPVPDPGGVGHIGPTIDWALNRLGQRLDVDQLAAHAGMSRRNFNRRFTEATGNTPARWILARRLDEGRRLLETTTWPISRIARSCGFGSAVTFRQNFVAAYSTTPTSYRQRFTTPQSRTAAASGAIPPPLPSGDGDRAARVVQNAVTGRAEQQGDEAAMPS
ncbi:GlxA family transcriptional regulator [Lentzea albidocapillata]|uniref:Transcriptional regulator GlxA family, contains an amidase domain and an AraC-type DNA-binding HTH domain n=1 Tax=Lentzea albidocapillata TaxID=40571 RepID=A0A1W2DIH2_9PSEU|nr:helix-turn-helix domain-containing protein [Lentzea albidocapillata]SMC96776.1 Transcriptional regulator GlxA family, contains an amidase domain and an AraC-type DNA-binding HTH domain [Lentzea albidocapillata]